MHALGHNVAGIFVGTFAFKSRLKNIKNES